MDLIVAGIGTGVGKTIVSATFCLVTNRSYWKPIQTGQERDNEIVKKMASCSVYPEVYRFRAALSPYAAAMLEGKEIEKESIVRPKTKESLVIELAGGILVPLTKQETFLDLFASWKAKWVLVSQHYLGSINHTLLTIEALKARGICFAGIIFNGRESHRQEEIILDYTKIPCLGHLPLEEKGSFSSYQLTQIGKQWTSI